MTPGDVSKAPKACAASEPLVLLSADLERKALEDMSLLLLDAEDDAVWDRLVEAAGTFAAKLVSVASYEAIADACEIMATYLASHARRVWPDGGTPRPIREWGTLALCARERSDFVNPGERSAAVDLRPPRGDYPDTPAGRQARQAGMEAWLRESKRRARQGRLGIPAGLARSAYVLRRGVEARLARGGSTSEVYERKTREAHAWMKLRVGIAPQVGRVRACLAEFAADAQFDFIVICGPANRFVQFAKAIEGGLHGEVVGPEHLPAEAPLDAGTEYALYEMGWHHPDPSVAGGNWWRSCTPDPTSDQMGSLAIATLHALGVLNQPLEITLGSEHLQVSR